MRRSALLLLLAPLLALLVLPAGSAQAQEAAAPAPRLAAGDFWERARGPFLTTEAVAHVEMPDWNDSSRDVVQVIEDGVPPMARGAQVGSGVSPTFPVTTTRVTWLRASDLAFLRAETLREPRGDLLARETAAAPCPVLRWPLEVNVAWTTTCEVTVEVEGGETRIENVTLHRTVASRENVAVAAGTFRAFRIETRRDGPEGPLERSDWYAHQACAVVKTETYADGSAEVQEVRSYRCAAAPWRPPTPDGRIPDTCGNLRHARCTPGPDAAATLLALGLVAGLLVARGAKRS